MSTATKVAIATTAGAVAVTAAGLATSDRGRKIRQKVSRKVQELVDAGTITLKNSRMRHVVEEIESVLESLLSMGHHGRNEASSTNQSGDGARRTARRGRGA